jgi:hypothetical protein
MRTELIFWGALAIGFLALAVISFQEMRRIDSKAHPFAGDASTVQIAGPVVHALRLMLVVELIGFVLAAAAATFAALT